MFVCTWDLFVYIWDYIHKYIHESENPLSMSILVLDREVTANTEKATDKVWERTIFRFSLYLKVIVILKH